MKAGRPAKIRSRPLIGAGGPMSRDQQRAVWDLLRGAYAGDPPDDLLDRIGDAFAAYKADATALAQAVGAQEERADAHAIAKDCRTLLDDLPAILADLDRYPLDMAARLRERLECFPPTVNLHLAVRGVDVWVALERLRAILTRPRSWEANRAVLAADLRAVADACDQPPELPTRTKPATTARDRFVQSLRDALGPIDDRDGVAADVLAALGVNAPKRL